MIKITQALNLVYSYSKNEMRRLSPIKNTEQYWTHLYSVYKNMLMHGVNKEDYLIAGILHDIFEDTNYTYDECVADYGKFVADLVVLVSKKFEEENLFLNIAGITDEELKKGALIIKIFDRIDNLFGSIFIEDKSKLRKYICETEDFIIPLSEEITPEYTVLLQNSINYCKNFS